MSKRFLIAVALVATGAVAASAQNQCYHNGVAYNEGDRVGETVCRDGRWVVED